MPVFNHRAQSNSYLIPILWLLSKYLELTQGLIKKLDHSSLRQL